MLLWLLGCAQPVVVGSFVGVLEGGQVQIAVALKETRATVYFAGSGDRLLQDTRWFDATRTEDTLTASDGDWTLSGEVTEDRVFGRLTDPAGVWEPFTTTPAKITLGKVVDGLWAPSEPMGACPTGVVLFNDGYQVQGGYCPEEGVMVPLEPVELTPGDGVITVAAQTADGEVVFDALPLFEQDALVK